MIRIGICDDSPAFLQEMKFLIDNSAHLPQNIITELYEDGDALISAHLKNPFDIILLDVVMPMLNGIEAAKDTIAPLLGQKPDEELVKEIYSIVMAHPEVSGVHDLVVHDYGPGRLMITLHAEVNSERQP